MIIEYAHLRLGNAQSDTTAMTVKSTQEAQGKNSLEFPDELRMTKREGKLSIFSSRIAHGFRPTFLGVLMESLGERAPQLLVILPTKKKRRRGKVPVKTERSRLRTLSCEFLPGD